MRKGSLLAVASLALLLATPARAQLFGRQTLDPAYCKQPTIRETVVYVDDTMPLSQPDWARKLAAKLRATLTPGEPVVVVDLSPEAGTSSEVWTGCWPNLPDAARADASKGTFLFSRSPIEQIGDQQKFFIRDLGEALTQIARKAKPAVPDAADGHVHKQLLRALASDSGRFDNADKTVRAIVYSDMAEDSDLGSVFKPQGERAGERAGERVDYGDRLGTSLRHGVFYAYGLGGGAKEGLPERTRAFWTAALASLSAVSAGMGSDLNVPGVVPVRAASVPVDVRVKDDTLPGRLSLLADADGHLVDSTVGVSRLSIVGLSGMFRCDAGAPVCKLDAGTSSGLVTSGRSEQLVMAGHDLASLSGHIGVKGTSYLYPVQATAP